MLDVSIYILASLTVFIVGIIGGWLFTRKADATFTKANLRTTIAVVVTIVWVVSIVAEIIIPTYTVSVLIHGIMGAVVGYLFSDEGITLNLGGKK